MLFREWTGHHFVTVPVKIRLSPSGPLRLPPFVPGGAHESGLVALETAFYARRYWGDDVGGPVTLYLSPTGTLSKEVMVGPMSRVTFGRAYSVPRLRDGNGDFLYVGADVERLEVTIEGERGIIEINDETFDALGIPMAG